MTRKSTQKKEEVEKILSKEEFLELELNHAKSDLINQEKLILSMRKELTETKKSLLMYMSKDLEKDLVDINQESQSLNMKSKKEKKNREDSLGKIKKRLKIKGKFGYNPDTLEVVEE